MIQTLTGREGRELIQIRIEIVEQPNGQVSLEAGNYTCKKGSTKLEHEVTERINEILTAVMDEVVSMLPGSKFAKGAEDVETMKGMEDLGLEGDSGK